MIDQFHVRTFERLKTAKKTLEDDFRRAHPGIIDIGGFSCPVKNLAEKARISGWRLKAAIRWLRRSNPSEGFREFLSD